MNEKEKYLKWLRENRKLNEMLYILSNISDFARYCEYRYENENKNK